MGKSLVRKNHFSSMERGFTSFTFEEQLPHVEVKGNDKLNKALGRMYKDATVGDLKAAMDVFAEDMHDKFVGKLNDICLSDHSADPRIKSVAQQIPSSTRRDVPLIERTLGIVSLCNIATKIARGYEEIGYEMDGGVAEYYLTKIHLAKAHLNSEIGKVGDIVVEDIDSDILYLETLAAKAKFLESSVDFDRGNDL